MINDLERTSEREELIVQIADVLNREKTIIFNFPDFEKKVNTVSLVPMKATKSRELQSNMMVLDTRSSKSILSIKISATTSL